MDRFYAPRTGEGGARGARALARRGGTYGTGAAMSKSRYPHRGGPAVSLLASQTSVCLSLATVRTQSTCSLAKRKRTLKERRRRTLRHASTAPSANFHAARTSSMSANVRMVVAEPHGQHQRRNEAPEHHGCSASATLVSATAQHSARTATTHASDRLGPHPFARAAPPHSPEAGIQGEPSACMQTPSHAAAATLQALAPPVSAQRMHHLSTRFGPPLTASARLRRCRAAATAHRASGGLHVHARVLGRRFSDRRR